MILGFGGFFLLIFGFIWKEASFFHSRIADWPTGRGRGLDLVHGHGDHLQHGRRDRRHDVRLPLQRPHARLPQGHVARRHRRPGRRVPQVAAHRRRGRPLRPGPPFSTTPLPPISTWPVAAFLSRTFGTATVAAKYLPTRLIERFIDREPICISTVTLAIALVTKVKDGRVRGGTFGTVSVTAVKKTAPNPNGNHGRVLFSMDREERCDGPNFFCYDRNGVQAFFVSLRRRSSRSTCRNWNRTSTDRSRPTWRTPSANSARPPAKTTGPSTSR